jgi:DNA-binding transcriptional LysR family regulator
MELRHLRYFIAVAEELHFSRAAARLHIAQPPLSQQIRDLEREIGVPLLARTQRQVRLTAAGVVFLEDARRIVAQAEHAAEAARQAQRGEIGRLNIGYVGSAFYDALPALLRVFHRRYPQVEINLRQRTTAEQEEDLRQGRIDIGVVRPPVQDRSLALYTFVEEPLLVTVPADHPLAQQATVAVAALRDEAFLMFSRSLGPGMYDQIIALCRQAGFSPRVAQEAVEMQAITGLVAAGFGIAIVPASARSTRAKDIAYLPIAPPAPTLPLALAWLPPTLAPVGALFLQTAQVGEQTHGE